MLRLRQGRMDQKMYGLRTFLSHLLLTTGVPFDYSEPRHGLRIQSRLGGYMVQQLEPTYIKRLKLRTHPS